MDSELRGKPSGDFFRDSGITRDQAVALGNSGWWEGKTAREIVGFQLFERLLCMPFSEFHEAVQGALCRSVFTHEFAHPDVLASEFLGERSAPTLEEVMEMIPESKRILVVSKEK